MTLLMRLQRVRVALRTFSSGSSAASASSAPSHGVLTVGGSVFVTGCAVAFGPFPETRLGLREALSGEHRTEFSPLWSYAAGFFGGLAGYSGTVAYVSRIGSTNPVLAGIKTPFALFGALMGGNLSYYTAPLLFDGSKSLSQLLSFTFDGLMADTLGRPPGQPPAWEGESILDSIVRRSDRDLNAASATISPRELEFDARMKALVSIGNGAGGAGAGERDGDEVSLEDKEAELKWLAGKLQQLRIREHALDSALAAAPSRRDSKFTLERQASQRSAMTAQKVRLDLISCL